MFARCSQWALLGLLAVLGVLTFASADFSTEVFVGTTKIASYDADYAITASSSGPTYIVKFSNYSDHSAHIDAIAAAVEDAQNADLKACTLVVPKRKAGCIDVYPSDFALVQVSCSNEESQLTAEHWLQTGAGFQAVSPDRAIRRPLRAINVVNEAHAHADDSDSHLMKNQQGRRQTPWSFEPVDTEEFVPLNASGVPRVERSLLYAHSGIDSQARLKASQLWEQNFQGEGIRVAVFDTGMKPSHPHFKNVKERNNFTSDKNVNDGVGHGTFVAGVISSSAQCMGFAQKADLYVFKVFTDRQVSYTSWFLDAFNYALKKKINVLNLSIGGPDYKDMPFVEKVNELTSNDVVIISAIGNDGPLYGTLNNPADQMDVIGVGGVDAGMRIAPFSSRGMSVGELPYGYGRFKPDIVTYGSAVSGSSTSGSCRYLSGTSVASPVVAGAVTLLASAIPPEDRPNILNLATLKQVIVEGATRLNGPPIFEQGQGSMDLLKSFELLKHYTPRASFLPPEIDTSNGYFWPFSQQSAYHSSIPVKFNVTILNGLGVRGEIVGPPLWLPDNKDGARLHLDFRFSRVLWPYTGWLGIYVYVLPDSRGWSGVASGKVQVTVMSPPKVSMGETKPRVDTIELPMKIRVQPTPPRHLRVLWDQYHNIQYPPSYVPRDDLRNKDDILDWNGDHVHTNFHNLYEFMVNNGYYVEVLSSDLTCLPDEEFGTLMIVDSEEEFHPEEIPRVHDLVRNHNMSLIVVAEWYNAAVGAKLKFHDDNTHSWWVPITGGGNVPALNDLLGDFNILFSDRILEGSFKMGEKTGAFGSGVPLLQFPHGGHVVYGTLTDTTGSHSGGGANSGPMESPILGMYQVTDGPKSGRIAVFGDSSCMDSNAKYAYGRSACLWVMKRMLDFVNFGDKSFLREKNTAARTLTTDLHSTGSGSPSNDTSNIVRPQRLEAGEIFKNSKVLVGDTMSSAKKLPALCHQHEVRAGMLNSDGEIDGEFLYLPFHAWSGEINEAKLWMDAASSVGPRPDFNAPSGAALLSAQSVLANFPRGEDTTDDGRSGAQLASNGAGELIDLSSGRRIVGRPDGDAILDASKDAIGDMFTASNVKKGWSSSAVLLVGCVVVVAIVIAAASLSRKPMPAPAADVASHATKAGDVWTNSGSALAMPFVQNRNRSNTGSTMGSPSAL